jgi:hypothetical protein
MRGLGRRTLPIVALVVLGIFLTGVLPVGNALWMRMLGVQGVVNIGAFSPTPQTGCTHSQGYWKNHPEAWPVEEIAIGRVTYPKTEAIAILGMSPQGGDATYILAHQLIAAKLNIANGADPSAVAVTIDAADEWLVAHLLGSNPGDPARAAGIDMAGILTEYNEGEMGPRGCEEEDEDDLVEFLVVLSPTATATETATSTATATDTASPTATATPTPTDTPVSVEAATPTETPTPTDTPLPEASVEDSPTPTETESPAPTESPTPVESESPSG